MEIFQKLNKDEGNTRILVTHEPDIAEYASRIVMFKDGRIKTDEQVQNRRNAAEELKNMPEIIDDEDEEDEEFYAEEVRQAVGDDSGELR
jgi:ABC-type lipoprotein export system ATPase subunit